MGLLAIYHHMPILKRDCFLLKTSSKYCPILRAEWKAFSSRFSEYNRAVAGRTGHNSPWGFAPVVCVGFIWDGDVLNHSSVEGMAH